VRWREVPQDDFWAGTRRRRARGALTRYSFLSASTSTRESKPFLSYPTVLMSSAWRVSGRSTGGREWGWGLTCPHFTPNFLIPTR
jgi:hypothetical protein